MDKKCSASKDSSKRKEVENKNKSRAESSFKKSENSKPTRSDLDCNPNLLQSAEFDEESTISEIDKALLIAENKVLRPSVIQPLLQRDKSLPEMRDKRNAPERDKKGTRGSIKRLPQENADIHCLLKVQETTQQPNIRITEDSEPIEPQILEMHESLKTTLQSSENPYQGTLQKMIERLGRQPKTREESLVQQQVRLSKPQVSVQNFLPKPMNTKQQRLLTRRKILMMLSKRQKEENEGESSIVKEYLKLPLQNSETDTPSMRDTNIEPEQKTNICLPTEQDMIPQSSNQSAENIDANITNAESLTQLLKCQERELFKEMNLDPLGQNTKNQDLLKIQETGIQKEIQLVENSQKELPLHPMDKRSRKSNQHAKLQTTEDQGLQQLHTAKNKKSRKIQPNPILGNKKVGIPKLMAYSNLKINQNQSVQNTQILMQPNLQKAETIHKEPSIIEKTSIQTQNVSENISPKILDSVICTTRQRAQNCPNIRGILKHSEGQNEESREPRIVRESIIQPQRIPRSDSQEVIAQAKLQRTELKSEQGIVVEPLAPLLQILHKDSLSTLEPDLSEILQRTENQVLPQILEILKDLKRQMEENDSEEVGELLVHPETIPDNYPLRLRESILPPLLQTTAHQDLPQKQDILKPKIQTSKNEGGLTIDRESMIEPHYSESNPPNMVGYCIQPPLQKTENQYLPNIQTSERYKIRSDRESFIDPRYSEINPPHVHDVMHPSLQNSENQNISNIQTAEQCEVSSSSETLIEPHYSEINRPYMSDNCVHPLLQNIENPNPPNIQTSEQCEERSHRESVIKPYYSETNTSFIHPSLQNVEIQKLPKIQKIPKPNIQTAENSNESILNHDLLINNLPFSTSDPPKVRESVIHPPIKKTENTHATPIRDSNLQSLLENLQPRTLSLESIYQPRLSFISNYYNKEQESNMNPTNVLQALDRLECFLSELEAMAVFNTQRYNSVIEKLRIWMQLMSFYEEISNKAKIKQNICRLKLKTKTDSNTKDKMNRYIEIEYNCRKVLQHLSIKGRYFQTAITLFDRYRMVYIDQSLILISFPLEQELQRNTMKTLHLIDKLSYSFNELSKMLAAIDKSAERRIAKCMTELQKNLEYCRIVFDFLFYAPSL